MIISFDEGVARANIIIKLVEADEAVTRVGDPSFTDASIGGGSHCKLDGFLVLVSIWMYRPWRNGCTINGAEGSKGAYYFTSARVLCESVRACACCTVAPAATQRHNATCVVSPARSCTPRVALQEACRAIFGINETETESFKEK